MDFRGTNGDDSIRGSDGDDFIDGGSGRDFLQGGAGRDHILGGLDNDHILGEDGDDLIGGQEGDDRIEGGAGVDQLYGDAGNDHIVGGSENDLLFGQDGDDLIGGQDGNDRIEGGAGVDQLYGDAGNDHILGGTENDRLFGQDGDDLIGGQDGDDRIEGGAGVDQLYGDAGNDLILGGTENDRLFGQDGDDLIGGQEGDDRIEGGAGVDQLYGDAGNDLIVGGTENDRLFGQDGDDLIGGQDGDDRIEGGAGVDQLYGDAGNDHILGGTENDLLFGQDGDDLIGGQEGDDRIEGGAGVDQLYGDADNDLILGGTENDRLFGQDGDDLIGGQEGDDRIEGGAGVDQLYGDAGNDLILGGTENDRLFGQDGADTIGGQEGDDRIEGGAGVDQLYGDAGNDLILGGTENDRLFGQDGADTIGGQEGDDRIEGGAGVDQLYGDAGNDLILGGTENDRLFGQDGADTIGGQEGDDRIEGGGGSDSFIFTTALGATNVDTIIDFNTAEDRIVLGGALGQPFAALASGSLGSAAFRLGSAATQAGDRILYDQATGALYYDSDGAGGAAAVQFAILQPGLALTAAHFSVEGPANNAPTITSGISATIAENSPTSTIIYQAIASDPDGDSITYSLSGADAALFTLDQSGALRLRSPADFETRSTYDVVIQAADSSGQSASRAVRINVSDVIEDGSSTTIITETASINDTTSSAQAVDRSTFTVASNPNLPDQTLPSATIQGAISTNGDRDFFTVTLQAGELLILDVDGVTGGLDALLRVYGPDGVELGEADDAPLDPGSAPHPASSTATLDSFVRFRAPASGTYTFSIESYEQGSAGSYNINVSIGPVATAAQIQEEDIQALISGARWDTGNLTYSFPTSAADYSDYPAPPAGEQNEPQNNFEGFNAAQQSTARQILAGIANLTDLSFTEQAVNPGGAILRFGMTDETGAAHAYLPSTDPRGGDSWFRNSPPEGHTLPIFDNPILGSYAHLAFIHEIGHALGLKHGHEFPALSPGHDSMEYSVMTYRSHVGDSLSDGYRNETYGFAQSLMMYDIAALQRMYGADFTFNGGDTVYRWSPTSGQMFINGVGQATPGANRVFMTVWDGGGVDTYDLSNYTDATYQATIDLRPGEWTTTSSVQVAHLGGGNYARGNVANALLFNGDPRSLIENAIGSSGSDILIGNQVSNRLTGGGAFDTFRWMSVEDSRPGAADVITDFTSGYDRIDLSFIDAVSGTEGNDAFRWIGGNAFTGSAGELRQEFVNGSLHIFGDVNGDGVADLDIIVSNQTTLGTTDFLF